MNELSWTLTRTFTWLLEILGNVQAYGDATITIEDTFTSVQAQRFVFTVTQRGPVYGPRVFELDGFAAVPEPSTWAMAAAGFALAAIARLRRVRRG